MSSPENGRKRKGAAFPHKDSGNLPHPVRTPDMEATLCLITRITNPSPPRSSLSSPPRVSSSLFQPATPPPSLLSHREGKNEWSVLLSAGSGRMDTK